MKSLNLKMNKKRTPDFKVWYCKANKKTGDPIIIKDMEDGKIGSSNFFIVKNVDLIMKFGNADGEAKRSGATTVLEVYCNNKTN